MKLHWYKVSKKTNQIVDKGFIEDTDRDITNDYTGLAVVDGGAIRQYGLENNPGFDRLPDSAKTLTLEQALVFNSHKEYQIGDYADLDFADPKLYDSADLNLKLQALGYTLGVVSAVGAVAGATIGVIGGAIVAADAVRNGSTDRPATRNIATDNRQPTPTLPRAPSLNFAYSPPDQQWIPPTRLAESIIKIDNSGPASTPVAGGYLQQQKILAQAVAPARPTRSQPTNTTSGSYRDQKVPTPSTKRPAVNDKFKGIGEDLYVAVPEDIADANRALARALGQVKNIFDATPQQLSTVLGSLESSKGLDKIEVLDRKMPQEVIDYYTSTFATGSGANGELLLTDVIGTVAGWVHNDELPQEQVRLKELHDLGELDNLSYDNGSGPGGGGQHGIYTIMRYHVIDDAYYTPSFLPNPSDPANPIEVPQWTIPSGRASTGDIFGDKSLALQHLIDAANTEIARLAALYPLQAQQSRDSNTNMTNQLKREYDNRVKAGIDPETTQTGTQTATFQLVRGLHDYGKDTSLGGTAYLLEQIANTSTLYGQAVIAAMREGRNIQRLADVGIETSAYLTSRSRTTEQATLQDSTFTVDEAKNSIQE